MKKSKFSIILYVIGLVLLISSITYGIVEYNKYASKYDGYESESGSIITGEDIDELEYESENYDTLNRIDYKELDAMLPSDDSVYVLISSTTCFYCAQLKMSLDIVLTELDREIYYIESNLLDDIHKEALGNRFSIETVPTLLKIDGETVDSGLIGVETEETLKDWFLSVE